MVNSVSLTTIIGDECFLVGYAGENDSGELSAYESIDDLMDCLKQSNPLTEANLMVVHGILTEARVLPKDFKDRHNNIYIVVTDPNDIEAGAIWHSEAVGDLDSLAAEIEFLIHSKKPYNHLTIEDIYILYGYELELGYSVNEDNIDEEIIEGCKEIANEVVDLTERLTFTESAMSMGGTHYYGD